jgi:hypothetical protein
LKCRPRKVTIKSPALVSADLPEVTRISGLGLRTLLLLLFGILASVKLFDE